MKYRFKLIIMASALFCMLPAVALADNVIKNLYVDGVWIDDANVGEGLTWPYNRITIGAEGDRWWLYNEYVGKMDEFAIYGGVLSQARIAAHYAAKDANATYVAAVSADNPRLWLRFEDASTDDNDLCANSGWIGIDANYVTTGGGAITQVAGINAGTLAINIPDRVADAPGHCVDVWDGNGDFSSDLEGDVTVELWVNYTDINDYPRLFQHNSGWDSPGGYGVMVNDPNELGVMGGGTTNYEPLAADINNGQWHHIVVTYDSTYLLPETAEYTAEVMADGPALYLRFEEADASGALVDSSGNDYWAVKSSQVAIERTVGSMGSAAHMNGGWVASANQQTEPCLPTDYNHSYAFGPNDITIEFWLKVPSTDTEDGYASFVKQCEGSPDPCLYAPAATRADVKCRIAFGDARVPNGGGFAYTNEGAWKNTDPNWHHYVIVWDEIQGDPCAMHVMWYSDGVNYKNSTYNAPGTALGYLGPEMDHILIGRGGTREAPAGNGLRGYIDEFAIYPKVLDITRINAHRGAWQPKTCADLWARQMQASWSVIDRDQNCDINFYDYAYFALEWALCNDPCDVDCTPNW